ncbi:hypothetical protein [Photobacterium minamisatsumaniensis]|uniref:hypothetical protein n=1 Tax=Photobacterium minamisatsumaniensis TaxID=2910233 RepID=UPI003D0D46E9
MFEHYKKSNSLLALAIGLALSGGAYAALPNILPPDNTGDLFALEDECDCVLRITPDKMISIEINKQDIIDIINDSGDAISSIDLSSKGIVVLKDGSLIFTVDDNNDQNSYIIKQNKSGVLSVLTSSSAVKTVTNEPNVDLESIIEGADGNLYVGDDSSDHLLRVDPNTGDVEIFVKEEEFEKLGKDFIFDIQPAIAADNRYIYLASDDSPNIVYKVDYMYGKPSIFAAGPNVDPHNLSKDNYVYLINDLFYPPRGYGSYYGLNSKKYPKKPTNVSGTYTLSFIEDTDYSPTTVTTDPIPWDASPYQVAQAINKTLGSDIKAMGVGTIGKPWVFDNPYGYRFISVNDGMIYGASANASNFMGPGPDDIPKEAVEANNHIEAIGTANTYGSVSFDLNATVGSGAFFEDQDLGEVSWHIGNSNDKIKYLLVKNTHLNPHDVSVTGKGTLKSPWVFKFKGGFERTQIKFSPNDNAYDAVPNEDILIGTLKDARAFDDPDGFMTRNRWGSITLEDDSGAHFLYNIDLFGDVSTLVTEWEFVRTNGGSVDIEGGLAYDSYGNLFVSNHSDDGDNDIGGNVFKITPLGHISIWIDSKDITDITGGDPEDVEIEGIAFNPSNNSKKKETYPSWSSWF